MRRVVDRLPGEAFLLLQRLLPQHLLMAVVGWIANIRARPVKNALIRGFVRLYEVDTSQVARPVPEGFSSFNDFFTRERRRAAGGSLARDRRVSGRRHR